MGAKRKIVVVTTSRAEYGIYRSVLESLKKKTNISLSLFVGGDHLAKNSVSMGEILASKIRVSAKVKTFNKADSPQDIASNMGLAVKGFGEALALEKPDIIIVLGDRYEMHAAALAALPFGIPVAHIHGGEETLGAFDNSLRHSITKLSHIHFASTKLAATRILKMGESKKRVFISGAPSLDNLKYFKILPEDVFRKKYNIPPKQDFTLVTFHPVTLEYKNSKKYIKQLLSALDASGIFAVFTSANKDTYGSLINSEIENYVRKNKDKALLVENFGSENYFSAMKYASAMIGNSSSGMVEAGLFELPVVNIGTRQLGREGGKNVISCDYDSKSILSAILKALSPKFRNSLKGIKSIYGDGNAAIRIADILSEIKLDNITFKKFELA